ncbi:S-layer homology domain-containing protein [Agathobaculum sp.]|uniref:S-layer homology domain-containing protein n=1 Tax=Agathobaculum sp. TaxID=2048138 RepID=UPI003A917A1A
MKKRNNRFLAGTLAGLMMLTMLPVTALAAQEGADDDAASDTSNNIVNVVSDGKNGQPAENNDVNVEGNGGTGNVQKFADDSSGDSENGQESADDSNGDSDDTAAPAPQEGENSGLDSNGEPAPTPPPAVGSFVAKIGTQTYETLEEAISVAQNGETIEVGQDITIEEGGLAFVEKDALTIKGVGDSKPTITMKDLGMSLSKTKVTFENIKIVEESVTNNPADSGGTANLVSNSDFTLKNASLELNGPADQTSGSGMYLYQKSNLYVKDGSTVAVSGYNGQRASGIYADNSEYDNMPNRNIQVTGNSSITITDCDWHGMTVNPIDILIDDNSKIDISQCGNASYGGGLGCYYGSVTISNHSKLITDDNNGSGWGVFANGLKVDATSSLSACNNKGCGAALASKSKIESGATVTLNENEKDGLRVYTGSNYWYGDVTIEEGANFTACENKDNGIEILPEGILDMQDGTVTHNHSGTYGGGLYNRGGTAKIGGKAVIYNNHADTAGDDIYSETEPSVSLSQVNNGWMLDDCKEKYQKEHPIVGWYHDGKEKLTDNAYKRWNGDGEGDAYYADEYTVGKEAVSDALALKAAHGQFCSVTYEVTGDVPSDASALPAAAKVKMNGNYTVAPVQTTSQSRYTFSGWRINGVGDVVTEIKDIQQDVKLIGVWTRRSSGGGGSSRPTVDIPDDVPTGLNGDDHFAYIVGYPNGNVEPNGNITRAEVATIFFRLLTEEVRTANSTQSNSLSDVTRGQWFNHAVSTLSSMGIVKGHNDGTFAPNAPITRAEFAAIAARFDDKNTDMSSKFTDIASHWAKNEIGIAANKGWINGYPDGTFRPNQYITRAEAMTLVNRVLNRLPENSSDLLDSMIKWPDNSDASAWYYLAVQEATNSHAYSDKSKDDKYEKWTTIRDARDWTELEK